MTLGSAMKSRIVKQAVADRIVHDLGDRRFVVVIVQEVADDHFDRADG